MRWLWAMCWLGCSAWVQSSNVAGDAQLLQQTPAFTAQRLERYFVVELKRPHRVFSTSYVNGGHQTQLRHLVNHQSMETAANTAQLQRILALGKQRYHIEVAEHLQMDPGLMALMGTAAGMQNLAHATETFSELRVDAFVTAGVGANALRAGDPARWQQTRQGNRTVDFTGTINIMLLINQPLAPGALIKAVMLATEAKSAALLELAVASVKSPHLATGTGTDQIIVAAAENDSGFVRDSASGHLKLGELIGRSVRRATLQALSLQNRLDQSDTADALYALRRFGLSRARLLQVWQEHGSEDLFEALRGNLDAMVTHPRVVASAYAYAAILDRVQYQALPGVSAREALRDQATQTAVAVSGKPYQWTQLRRELPSDMEAVDLFALSLLKGWGAKWP